MSWVGLMVASGAGWSTLDAVRKHLSIRHDALVLVTWMTAGQIPLYGTLWFWQNAQDWPQSSFWWPALALILMNLVANALIVFSLRCAPISMLLPLLSLSPVMTSLLGLLINNEWPTALQWIGIVTIVAGALGIAILSTRERSSENESSTDARLSTQAENNSHVATEDADGPLNSSLSKARYKAGVLSMIVVAFLFSLSTAVDKVALSRCSSLAFHLLFQNLGIAILCLGYLMVVRQGQKLRAVAPDWPWIVLSVIALAIALGLQMQAVQVAKVGMVDSVKRGAGMASGVGIGWLFFKEQISASLLVCIAIIVIGVVSMGL